MDSSQLNYKDYFYTPMPTLNKQLVSYFYRHVVQVFFSFKKGEEIQNFVITAFILSVYKHWFLITAGHCIGGIDTLIGNGYTLVQCRLIDSLGSGAKHKEPIPFDYANSYPICLSDDCDFDYGIMALSPYYQGLLLANNIQALNEAAWKDQPQSADFYILLGVPAELVKINPQHFEIEGLLFFVEKLDQRPDGFSEVNVDLFYGKVNYKNVISSFKGMSGGPVFAFRRYENGEMRYWLAALQSRCLPDSQLIAAYPTKLLGSFIEDLIVHAK